MGRVKWGAAAATCVVLGTAATWWSSCRAPASHPPPNVLLILVDTLRADHLGAYGYDRPTSPTFDALAARGTLFTRAHSTTSWTNPAVESLFTGARPRVIQPGATEFIAPNTLTLPQAFRAGGYRTGAMIANPVLPPDLGFGQGFDNYVAVSGWVHGWAERPKQPAEGVNAAALEWLKGASGERPWFLYLHYMDAHYPYEPPHDTAIRFWRFDDVDVAASVKPLNATVRERPPNLSAVEIHQITDLYDAAVAHLDAQLKQLLHSLDAAGQLANTVVCITADHGEELGDHGGLQHARTLYQEVLHIPLLLVSPRQTAAARIDRLVSITGIGRTLLDMAGLQDRPFPGRSIVDAPQQAGADESLVAELMPGFLLGTQHTYAALHGTMKLVVTATGTDLLFDLAHDAAERQSVAAEQPQAVADLKQRLAQATAPRLEQPANTPDAATRERLRALGYDF